MAEVEPQRVDGIAYREAVPAEPSDLVPALCLHGFPGDLVHVAARARRPRGRRASRHRARPPGLRRLAAGPAGTWERHVEAVERFRRALDLDRVALVRPRLGRPDRPALGVRPPRRGRGARALQHGLLPGRQVARDGAGAAHRGRGRAAGRGDDPRGLRPMLARGLARASTTRPPTSTGRRSRPRTAGRGSSTSTARATSRSSSPTRAGSPSSTCRRCSSGARTTSSRPSPAPTASSASSRTRSWCVIEGAGHFVYADEPQRSATEVVEFLAESGAEDA